MNSTTHLTNSSGAILEKYKYDAFGMPFIYNASSTLVSGGTAYGNRFLYTGREWIKDNGIYDYRNRAYAPSMGRFLQTDPIGFSGQDVNLYRYVWNCPSRFRDPSGLCCEGEKDALDKAKEALEKAQDAARAADTKLATAKLEYKASVTAELAAFTLASAACSFATIEIGINVKADAACAAALASYKASQYLMEAKSLAEDQASIDATAANVLVGVDGSKVKVADGGYKACMARNGKK